MSRQQPFRIGMIVPSSNTTMETELPALLRRREQVAPERFTFHGARMRMREVTTEELAMMDDASIECAVHLSDTRCDVLAYACLVAIMVRGRAYQEVAEARLAKAAADNGGTAPVVSSAGALVDALHALGARRTALVTPYAKPLTKAVADYVEGCGVEVRDAISLEVTDNVAVGRLDPGDLPEIARRLRLQDVDAVVLSACVQMRSLTVIPRAERELGLPVLSAATATTGKILIALGLEPVAPDAGRALALKTASLAT